MTMNISQIETAIKQLPPNEFAALSEWFEDYEAEIWDARIAEDLKIGKLNSFIDEAQSEVDNGLAKEL